MLLKTKKNTQVILILFVINFLFFNCLNQEVLGDDINEDGLYIHTVSNEASQPATVKNPTVEAAAAVAMEMESGRVLYEKNAYVKRAMASTTKIMTAIIALEKGRLDDIVEVSRNAAGVRGSTIHLKAGEKLTLKELLYGLMLNSGNDASIAIAEHIGGSVEGFCNMMNEKAIELGAKNTNFKTPHGLDAPEHYTTAYELANITRYAMNNTEFTKIVSTKQANITGRSLHNTNELLGSFSGINGVKTGYTGQAGRCLVTSATRNGMQVITVVLGAGSRALRAGSSRNILEYAFNSYRFYELLKSGETIGHVPVIKGKEENVSLAAKEAIRLPLREDEYAELKREIETVEILNAPVYENIESGRIRFVLKDKVIAQSDIVTSSDVGRKKYLDYLYDIISAVADIILQPSN